MNANSQSLRAGADAPRRLLQRIERSVRHTDGNLIFTVAVKLRGAPKFTAAFAARHAKPFVHLPLKRMPTPK